MKRHGLILLAILVMGLSACAGSTRSLSKNEIDEAIRQAEGEAGHIKREQANQTRDLALEYYDQGGDEKSAELFLDAADLYRELNDTDAERRNLRAAAGVQLRCSKTQAFFVTIARLKGLIANLEMPSEEERFFINLSDHMKGQPLMYPVKGSWEVIFKK